MTNSPIVSLLVWRTVVFTDKGRPSLLHSIVGSGDPVAEQFNLTRLKILYTVTLLGGDCTMTGATGNIKIGIKNIRKRTNCSENFD